MYYVQLYTVIQITPEPFTGLDICGVISYTGYIG